MANLNVFSRVDGVDYGLIGSGDPGAASIREISFGPAASGSAHFDIRGIKVGTLGYGSSDVWAPALASLADFDGIVNVAGGTLTASGGILAAFAASPGDMYGWKDLGADYTDLYVEFQVRRYADDSNADFHDISVAGELSTDGGFEDGVFASGGVLVTDGVGGSWNTAPPRDGTTWVTIQMRWQYDAVAPDFSLTLSVDPLAVSEGTSETTTLTAHPVGGDTESITLTYSGAPAGVTLAFATNPITAAGSSVIAVSATLGAAVGSYPITITATGTSNTHTIILTVDVLQPPQTCADALGLTPFCSVAAIDNSTYPDEPLASDPLFTIYADSPLHDTQFRRQRWFKLHNPTGIAKYAHFVVSRTGGGAGVSFAIALYLECPAVTELDLYANALSAFGDGISSVTTISGATTRKFGTLVPSGGTVYVELAGDGPTWSGSQITLEWNLLDVDGYFDGSDIEAVGAGATLYPPPFGPSPTLGLSKTLPYPPTAISYAGFPPFTNPGFGSSGDRIAAAHIFHAGYHYVAALRIDDTGLKWPDGDSELIFEHLGVWQFDAAGTQVAFTVIDTVTNGLQHSVAGHDQGESFEQNAGSMIFCSDGTNLWLVISKVEPQTNPYDASLPPHDWLPLAVAVYSQSAGWAEIGSHTAQSNTRQSSIFAGPSGAIFCYDATASANEPGVLHLVVSEQGSTVGAQPTSPFTEYGQTTPIDWVTSIRYSSFSGAAKTSERNLFYTAADAGLGVVSGPHDFATGFAIVRNDHGSPWFLWVVPKTGGSSGYQLRAELYDISGGGLSLLHAFTGSDLAAYFASPTAFTGASFAWNLAVDPFDSKDVYVLFLGVTSSVPGAQAFRLDPANPATPLYLENSSTFSAFHLADFPGHKGLGIGPGFTLAPYEASLWFADSEFARKWLMYDYCFHGFQKQNLSANPPLLDGVKMTKPHKDGSLISYLADYNLTINTSIAQTQIIERSGICSIGSCVVVSGFHVWVGGLRGLIR